MSNDKLKLPSEPSDPKLKEAMKEIVAVLEKYDIAGIAVIQSPSHAEWLNHISPSWSCAKMFEDERGTGIHVKALRKDYHTEEAHRETVAATSGMILAFASCCQRIQENMEGLAMKIADKVGIDHIGRFDK